MENDQIEIKFISEKDLTDEQIPAVQKIIINRTDKIILSLSKSGNTPPRQTIEKMIDNLFMFMKKRSEKVLVLVSGIKLTFVEVRDR